jgi:hypothetical protein
MRGIKINVLVVSVVTAAVIGAWNLVSVALEYLLLILIYRFLIYEY